MKLNILLRQNVYLVPMYFIIMFKLLQMSE